MPFKKLISTKERFEQKFKINPETGCWEWIGLIHPTGYGCFSIKEKGVVIEQRAHRASYLIYKGKIPENLFICHRCDNPGCVNPDHLWADTPKANTRDSMNKGRRPSNPCPSVNAYKHGCRCEQCKILGSLNAKRKHNKEKSSKKGKDYYYRNRDMILIKNAIYRANKKLLLSQKE